MREQSAPRLSTLSWSPPVAQWMSIGLLIRRLRVRVAPGGHIRLAPMSTSAERLVWIDCEMTGLNLEVDELVEIAVVITDFELKLIDPGIDLVIKANAPALEQMNDFVRNMHTTSGLIEEIPDGLDLEAAQRQVMEYVRSYVPDAHKAPIAGNTIGTDRMFIAKFMPELDTHLHYRNVDVSSIKELSRHWYPRIYFSSPKKNGGHRALADILESIRELDYYRKTAFTAPPGPSTEECQTASTSIVENWAPRM